ncbi:MAG: response regulator [Verrucomicrobiota bacterium]
MKVLEICSQAGRARIKSIIRGRGRWVPALAVAGDGSLPDDQRSEPRKPVDSVVPVPPTTAGQSVPVHGALSPDEPRVLVVDDEDSVRRACTLALRGEALLADGEGSPLVAFDRLLGGERCDVLVLDYFMPDLDGLAFLRALDEAGLERPAVLMASAHADGAVAREALALGVWDFISKPLTPVDLRNSVQRLLQRPALAAAGDSRSMVLRALVARRWDEADRLLSDVAEPTETDRLLHGLLRQVCNDEAGAAAHFAQAHWWAGWVRQGPEIWTELARRLDT